MASGITIGGIFVVQSIEPFDQVKQDKSSSTMTKKRDDRDLCLNVTFHIPGGAMFGRFRFYNRNEIQFGADPIVCEGRATLSCLDLSLAKTDLFKEFDCVGEITDLSVIDDVENAAVLARSFPWVDIFGQVHSAKEDRSSFQINVQQWTPLQPSKKIPLSITTCIVRDSPKWKSGKPNVEKDGIVHVYGHITGLIYAQTTSTSKPSPDPSERTEVTGFTIDVEKVDFLARPSAQGSPAKSTPARSKIRFTYENNENDSPLADRPLKRRRTRAATNNIDSNLNEDVFQVTQAPEAAASDSCQ